MEIHIGERVAEVQLVEKEGNQVRIAVDGQMYDVDIVIADNGVCSVIFNGQSYNMEIVRSDNGKRYKVNRDSIRTMSGSSTPRRNISVRAAKTTGARTIRSRRQCQARS